MTLGKKSLVIGGTVLFLKAFVLAFLVFVAGTVEGNPNVYMAMIAEAFIGFGIIKADFVEVHFGRGIDD